MINFRLGLEDLAATSFAHSPLQETVLSVRMWGPHAARLPALAPVRAAMRPAFARLDRELLTSLVARRRYWVPDFLTPRPPVPAPAFAAELAALRATDPALLAPDIARTFGPLGEPVPPRLAAGLAEPPRLLAEIADALEAYWAACVRPWWPRIRTLLVADIAYRARTLAEHGAGSLLAGIGPRLTWHDGILTIRRQGPWAHRVDEIPVDGRRLLLTPSCFVDGVSTMLAHDAPPHIVYTPRGLATLAESTPPPVPRALARLIGEPRARLLALLAEPATTTELAGRLGVTPPAVSQHLSALAAGRLVERTREGRQVRYRRSPLGETLVEAQESDSAD
jgi:DNA-binding transcriptional ArsR family regulator